MQGRPPSLTFELILTVMTALGVVALATPGAAQVHPGDMITSANTANVKDMVSPGVYQQLTSGTLAMKIVPTERIDWPPPYKAATEKYAAQASLSTDHKNLVGYVAGLPFPKIDPNDPDAGVKLIWNSQFRPGLTDDYDLRFFDCEISKGKETLESVQFGHYAGYSLVGRTEVQPLPADPEFKDSNRYWLFGMYPILTPAELRGGALTRFRFADPSKSDESWAWNPGTRRLRQLGEEMLRDPSGLGWAPDRYLGFNSKIEEFNYKLLGQRPMLGCFHAARSPASACTDNSPNCAENWETRNVYVVEANPKSSSSGARTIVYLDSETWFSPYLDTYKPTGELQEEDIYWLAYGDRSTPQATVAVYPFKRQFAVAALSFDTREGVLTKCYLPSSESQDTEGWYIDMGTVDKEFFTTKALERAAH